MTSILLEEHLVCSSTEVSEAWCLAISREGSVPSRATLAYVSVVWWGLEDCYPHSYIVDILNWSWRWVFRYSLIILAPDSNTHCASSSINLNSEDCWSLGWSERICQAAVIWVASLIHSCIYPVIDYFGLCCNPSFPFSGWGYLPMPVSCQLFLFWLLQHCCWFLFPVSHARWTQVSIHIRARHQGSFLFSVFLTPSLSADNAPFNHACWAQVSIHIRPPSEIPFNFNFSNSIPASW